MIQMTIPYLLKRAAFKCPNREAIVCEAGRWTYGQWETNANKRAWALAQHGIKKDDHVATIFLNCSAWTMRASRLKAGQTDPKGGVRT